MGGRGAEFIAELLRGADPAKLAALLRENKGPRPKRSAPENGPIKQYTVVIKNYTCLTCDTKFKSKHNMTKGDQTFCIQPDGTVKEIIISGKVEEIILQSFVSKCGSCEAVASTWSKEELLRRWMLLVKASSFREIVEYRKAVGLEYLPDNKLVVRKEG